MPRVRALERRAYSITHHIDSVMLVALDNAQLVALCHPRTDRAVLRDFHATWEASGCVLALNGTTLREFAHGAAPDDASRQELLKSFKSVRGIPNPEQLHHAEFVEHVDALARDLPASDYVVRILNRLRERLFRPLDQNLLAEVVTGLHDISSRHRRFDDLVAQGLDLRRQLGEPWPPRRLEGMTKEQALRDLDDSTESYPEPYRTHQRMRRARFLEAYYADPTDRRRLMAIYCDIEAIEVVRTAPYEDFFAIQYLKDRWFAALGSGRLTTNGLVRDPEHAQSILSRLSPYLLPGVSLGLALRREQVRDRTREIPANDVADIGSLMFAPYVDLACVDKRVYDFIQRARAPKKAHLLPEGVGGNLVDGRKLTSVTKAIAEFQGHSGVGTP